jgi:1,4-alpha-glucan branching enzyme
MLGYDGRTVLKADPFAFHAEVRPATASKVWSLDGYKWNDIGHLKNRKESASHSAPMVIYEMHIGAWRLREGYRFANMREVADELSDYLVDMNFTHVEIMPVTEYPLDDSWGYQVTGYYAVTSRYGTPQDFMYFVDTMHQKGIGVIMDWVPAHFPKDAHGLARFDGTCLFEHQNPMQANHPQWGTLIFNYSRPEVVSFLISSAMFFFDVYHIDGIRVDAVTSMLYLDYARNKGEFVPNEHGGNIDYHAAAFLKKLNAVILTRYPGTITIAEESTAYPKITKPPRDGGLGFMYKWNMGFMHDTLKYMSVDPVLRQYYHNKLTFSLCYAFSENYILPYSHDEVVHGKKSLLDKMYGSYDEKFTSLRVLLGYMYAHPGKKLLFMGSEFGQFIEWAHKKELDWFLLGYERHRQMQQYVKALNAFYNGCSALWEVDDSWEGFSWLNVDNAEQSAICFLRRGKKHEDVCVCAFNFTPVPVIGFVVGLPTHGVMREAFSSDDMAFGGSGQRQTADVAANAQGFGGHPFSAVIDLPPLTATYFVFIENQSVRGDEV